MATPTTDQSSPNNMKGGTIDTSKNRATVTPSLIVSATIFPALASVTAVTCYILFPKLGIVDPSLISGISIILGVIIGFIAWMIGAWIYRPYIDIKRANVNEHHNISTAFTKIDETINTLSNPQNKEISSFNVACSHRDYVRIELQLGESNIGMLQNDNSVATRKHRGGFRWVNGFGYVNLWRRLHRAEEELVHVDDLFNVINVALVDITRLGNSRIANGTLLITELRSAIKELEDPATDTNRKTAARSTIMRTRNITNVFRDDSLEAIFLSRKYLFTVTLAMSYLAYVLLSLAIIANTPASAIIAAGVYYLVGAIIGLFTRLNQDAESPTVLQDHSLSGVRLLYLPMFSGLAAIGGVLITSILSLSAVQAISNGAGGPPGPTQPLTTAADTILQLFALDKFPSGILIAALFGLSPNLLTSRLKQQADLYRNDLKSIDGSGKR